MSVATLEPVDSEAFRNKVTDVHQGYDALKREIAKVVIGQEKVIELMILSLMTNSH